MRPVLLAAIASMGLIGCVGSLDMPPDPQPAPVGSGTNPPPAGSSGMGKMMFDQNVYPIISSATAASGCAAAGCHGAANSPSGATTAFVSANPSDGYATATSFTSLVGNFTATGAGILTQVTAGHNGRLYSDAERQKITDWLAQEVTERAGGTGTGTGMGGGTGAVMDAFSSCMNITDFNAANMSDAWGTMTASNNSRCETCHGTGGYGMIASQIPETTNGTPGMFTVMSTNPNYIVQFFKVDPTTNKVVINMTSFEGVSAGQAPHTEHPRFNADQNQGITALTTFFTAIDAKVTAGGCGPTKLSPAM
jgi:hypothetical protein